MKHFSILLIFLLLLGCQEDDKLSTQQSDITVIDGRLKFSSEDQFLKAFSFVSEGSCKVTNDRLQGLDYRSLASVLSTNSKSEAEISVLDEYGYRVLLNDKGEVQIGQNIFVVTDRFTSVLDLAGNLVRKTENSIQFYNKETKKFVSPEADKQGKAFGINYYEELGTDIQNGTFGVRYQWLRYSGIIINYYYKTWFQRPLYSTNAVVVDRFERQISDCYQCTNPTSNPYGGVVYNTSNVQYYCGSNSISGEVNYGAYLRAEYKIFLTPTSSFLHVLHMDDLDI